MKVSQETEDAIREHFDRLDEDSHHWTELAETRSKIKDLLTRKTKDNCICEYYNKVSNYPTKEIKKVQMFHVREKYGSGLDVSLFKGSKYICKECGSETFACSERQRKRDYNTKFVRYEDLDIQ
jgi:hypothetical protein